MCVGGRGRGNDALYVFNHSASNNSYSGFWSQIYNILAQVNNLIVGIDVLTEAGKGSAALNHIKAQALTIRAMCYYDLVRLYGKPYDMDKSSYGVPLVLEVLDASAEPTRASVEQIYSQVVSDLNAAIPLFNKTQKSNGMVNYYANVAMQARVHLQMQNYSAALTAAEEVISNGGFTLYTNDNWLSSWSKQFQSESIFELYVATGQGALGNGSLGSMMTHTSSGTTNWNYFMASDSFLELLGEDSGDIRWGLMAKDEKSETGEYPEVRRGCCYKYVGGINSPGDGKTPATSVNIKVIRLSEIYLVAAEAAFANNNKEKAATYLQAIRKRAPNLDPATAANITLKMIQDEYSKELLLEGHRFFDMMRWNKTINFTSDYWSQSEVTNRPASIDRTYYKVILPLSTAEILANPAIEAQQNPGY